MFTFFTFFTSFMCLSCFVDVVVELEVESEERKARKKGKLVSKGNKNRNSAKRRTTDKSFGVVCDKFTGQICI